jgi:putative peptidoglycan lipid II flippase
VRAKVLLPVPHRRGVVLRVIVASVAMALALYWGGGDTETWLRTPTLERMIWLAALVFGGALVYFSTLWVLGVRAGEFRLRTSAT